jgi:NADPH:quinone reductase
MRAILVHAYGGPEAMQLEPLPPPKPGPSELLVRVEAAGVNFVDVYQRSGAYRGAALPLPLGLEGAGVIEQVGEASGFEVGQRVAWATARGSYATQVIVPAAQAVPVPNEVSSEQAAAVMLQGMTAQYLCHATYPLEPGDACLVHAAAGGVGLLLCQMARRLGAEVFGTVSTEEKAALAHEAGAHHVIRYTEQDFESEVRRLTGGKGVHVVFDSVGQTTFMKSLGCLAPRGMLVLFGQSSGPVPAFDPQILNAKGSLFLTRPKLQDYTATRGELLSRARDVLDAVATRELKVRIGAKFPLAEAPKAHVALEGRSTAGKVLLLP